MSLRLSPVQFLAAGFKDAMQGSEERILTHV